MSDAAGPAMRSDFPHSVRVIDNEWIPLADGTRLAARIWLPADALEHPVPAILEYLPYRKDDGTAVADAMQHTYFAGCGYAGVRVDLRGTGDSDGLLRGEYLQQEQDDALEVLEWLARQPWCTGDVGMIGYSWGGFNGLQVAARRPPQLKAVISVDSTDDRYLDDCHYMGGCLLGSDMLKWAASMLCYAIQPPDPRFVGDRWREMWLERLREAPELAGDWVSHQRRDEFWAHGSIAEDYGAIECPVMVVGGWTDAYVNAVPRLLARLEVPRLGIIGPWAHMMPHYGVPGPAIGFLQEAVRWWDRWLKGLDSGIMREPRLRAWIERPVAPARFYAERPGRWVGVAEDTPPDPGAHFLLGISGTLERVEEGGVREGSSAVWISGRQACGEAAGVWCANGLPDELATDQRADDACSLSFTSEPLEEELVALGNPLVSLRVCADKPLALVAVRLEDVLPDGESLLVSWGMLNLAHRDSHANPTAVEPGRGYDVALALRACGHAFEPGHRLRLAVSPTYWPHAWPSPEPVTLSVHPEASILEVPVAPRAALAAPAPRFDAAEVAAPADPGLSSDGSRTRHIRFDVDSGRHVIHDAQRITMTLPAGATRTEFGTDTYSIAEDDPLSAAVRCVRETTSVRNDFEWSVRVDAEMTCDAEAFVIVEEYAAFDAGTELFSARREQRIRRDHV